MLRVSKQYMLNSIQGADLYLDYPRTLREWGRRVESRLSRENLVKDFPEMKHSEAEFEVLKRKWRYLFVYAEVGFARAYATLCCWTYVRPVSSLRRLYGSAVYSRDYDDFRRTSKSTRRSTL